MMLAGYILEHITGMNLDEHVKKNIYEPLNLKDITFNPLEKEFFRKGLSNPESEWFLDEGRTYPKLNDVINLIHKADSIAFLAHPYEYGFENFDDLFETI